MKWDQPPQIRIDVDKCVEDVKLRTNSAFSSVNAPAIGEYTGLNKGWIRPSPCNFGPTSSVVFALKSGVLRLGPFLP